MPDLNSTRLHPNLKLLTRIFSKIKISISNFFKGSPCWEWQGKLAKGYGRIFFQGKQANAHRYMYEFFVEVIPKHLVCDHLCRNRICVNPAHLEPVPNRTNVLRGIGASAQNANKTYCKHGHQFTEENTIFGKTGRRSCRICTKNTKRKYYERKRQLAPDDPYWQAQKQQLQKSRVKFHSLPDDDPRKIHRRQKEKERSEQIYALPYDHPQRVAMREYGKQWRKNNR